MATPKDLRESTLPTNKQFKKKTIDLLPRQFKTDANLKFLSATIDQLISKGNPEKLNAYIGRKTAKSYSLSDNYVPAITADRASYQLEPAIVSTDNYDNVSFFGDYIDYINQIGFFNESVANHSNLNENEFYAWDPRISWDKFVNYSQYYWVPHGPAPITISGQLGEVISEFSVTVDNISAPAYVFTPDGATKNPLLTLYKGQTYVIKVNCPGHPIAFSTQRTYVPAQESIVGSTSAEIAGVSFDQDTFDNTAYDPKTWIYNTSVGTVTTPASNLYNIWTTGVESYEIDPVTGVRTPAVFVEYGEIVFTVPVNAPTQLYYVSKNDINVSGLFNIESITESTFLDVDRDIVGKPQYSFNGFSLSNGMKINFSGKTVPEKYSRGNWYVEGVGESIHLISEESLEVPAIFVKDENVEFDNENFDSQGFDVNNNFPAFKDYILINRGSLDRNTWSRYNRWFHEDVLRASAEFNNVELTLDQSARAARPIIEFNANLQLFNHGAVAKQNVDLIDTFTKDVFSTVEGSAGYIVDGISLVAGMRVLFAADTDSTVNGRIYKVTKVIHLGVDRLSLQPTDDSIPVLDETVLVLSGNKHKGKMFYYTSAGWKLAQNKTSINQPPMFDVFDSTGVSFSDKTVYPGSTFAGSKVFSYASGSIYDDKLGFNISYRNIENLGDILFNFNLHTDMFTYQEELSTIEFKIESGVLKVNAPIGSKFVSGWTTAFRNSWQPVIREYSTTSDETFFKIDVYDNSATLDDLQVNVKVNGISAKATEFDIYRQDADAFVRFFTPVAEGSFVVLETVSTATKNTTGYYKFPINLENNPENLNLTDFTLGEIIEHTISITENSPAFIGELPGNSNLRDIGNVSAYGTKVVQHSAPLSIVAYHIVNRKYNVIDAIKKSRIDYSKFKKKFIRTAYDLGFDGETSTHLDKVLETIAAEIDQTSPYYFSDMVPFGASQTVIHNVIDNSITEYPLIFSFSLSALSEKAVLIYLNEKILVHGIDYEFVNGTFVNMLTDVTRGDEIKIVHYSTTDGVAVPPTPTKLGLYPAYMPEKFVDNTYQTPVTVIRGHDGSITVAFGDFRDDLLLELETRIFNNLKMKYDPSMFDISDYISGYYYQSSLSLEDLNTSLSKDFVVWSTVVNKDYSAHDFFDQTNSFTFNYSSFYAPDGTLLPGYWRGIYNYVYGTDAPHVRPWEMLGMTIKPKWWDSVYGPAPYTKDNLILWSDLSQGLVKDPAGAYYLKKYARPTLLSHIPVDSQGGLVPPNLLGLVNGYIASETNRNFKFGDFSPVEAAWRKSAEFPFALLSSVLLARPAKVFATGFDRSRQVRDLAGQLIYNIDGKSQRISHRNLVFPNSSADSIRVFTSGLVNYIADYAQSISAADYIAYKDQVSNLKVRLASKLGGFSTVEKLKVVLDSRSPTNNGNVFIPTENYRLFLNTSAPVDSVYYSGVIIEKSTAGFIIRGYNQKVPTFDYFKPTITATDPVVNVGGIYESYVDWSTEHYYTKGSIVRYDQSYFRVTVAHRSSSAFELKYFAKLVELPVTGGRDIVVRSSFEKTASKLFYGSVLKSIQDVVDFLLGYGKWLEGKGFVFDSYNKNLDTVVNWLTSVKEFAFWTTQNWSEGAVISLSPAAQDVEFYREYTTVDNIYDPFYGYSVLRQDGTSIEPAFANSARLDNGFSLKPRNIIDDGIYHVELNLVQKEHVLLLDNKTVFNDVIYNQVQGYRQDRVKLVGYRTADWTGDFNIPGFVYDEALVSDWKKWTDYPIGETVKYKEFYYSAIGFVPGAEEFDYNLWYKLSKKPESKLLPNWEYKAMQFEDFYDLDSDNFDIDQQKFAQHLIGYQPREYLSNIINDDISQYKFYQGMIREKGTKNSLSKLFDALNFATKDSIEFYEEWAIRLGQYGASDGFDEIEIKLDESRFLVNPQPISVSRIIDQDTSGFVYKITPADIYISPTISADGKILPSEKLVKEQFRTAGFARFDDVDHVVSKLADLTSIKISTLSEGDYFWVGFDRASWNVYRFTIFDTEINNLSIVEDRARIYLNHVLDADIVAGSMIGIADSYTDMDAIYRVYDVGVDYFEIELDATTLTIAFQSVNENPKVNLYKFTPMKLATIDNLDSVYNSRFKGTELVWITKSPIWEVWKRTPGITHTTYRIDQAGFGSSVSVDTRNTVMAVASSTNSVHYYRRISPTTQWTYIDELTPAYFSDGRQTTHNSFGKSTLISGTELFVSVPRGRDAGYVVHYTTTPNGFFTVSAFIDPMTSFPGEHFGEFLSIVGDNLIIASKGTGTVPASITSYSISAKTTTSRIELPGQVITDIAASETGFIVVGTLDSKVKLYKLSPILVPVDQELTSVVPELYGISVDITNDGTYIAVGAPDAEYTSSAIGKVFLYKKTNEKWELFQTLSNPEQNYNERFGTKVRFNLQGDQLVIAGATGTQKTAVEFDSSFDLETTTFSEIHLNVGQIRVFDRYDSKFVYSTELETVSRTYGTNYGHDFIITDRAYITDPADSVGAVYEYAPVKAWSLYRSQDEVVAVDKIKSVFLYNTTTEEMISQLDVLDPIRGKIIGIADQELKFKTHYDPATYSIGDSTASVDVNTAWTSEEVGRLWWDLSTTKWVNPYQGSTSFKSNTWNTLFPGASVDIYEWVESDYTPAEWDSLADSEIGLASGISGKSKYGNAVFSIKAKYDVVADELKPVYYFWVKNKTTVPDVYGRKISAADVSTYIADPKSAGLRYAMLLSPSEFSLVNCADLLVHKDVAINFRYWNIENTSQNIHSHYQLVSADDPTSQINEYIENKWIDSLIGYNTQGFEVPDPRLPKKLKYGVLSTPRQSMFVNRIEALKQAIERVNSILINELVVDNSNITKLFSKSEPPAFEEHRYDIELSTYSELRFISMSNVKQAVIAPIFEDGKLKQVDVIEAGRGYIVPPSVNIIGSGTGATVSLRIDSSGSVVSAKVITEGEGYDELTRVSVRPFTVLIKHDENVQGTWTLNIYNAEKSSWVRIKTQTFDVSKYWNYADWYAAGYSQYTKIDREVDFSYQLPFAQLSVGQIVKIRNQGTGGWILLERVDVTTGETTVDYKVIGRQSGTIQFKPELYTLSANYQGYDSQLYDSEMLDSQPTTELRVIFDTLKNNILVGSLTEKYKELFFASLRYVFTEQIFVDWAFKTSFVNAVHNLGELTQPATFKPNNLVNYEKYINEVKPYKTKVREYVSNFESIDRTQSVVTDFDLPSRYDPETDSIKPFNVKVSETLIDYDSSKITEEPYASWLSNVGYEISSIEISNPGSKYAVAPLIDIVGYSEVKATARAFVSQGRITKIVVDNPGKGYLTTPIVNIIGSENAEGEFATAIAILGNGLARTIDADIKFDRVSSKFTRTSLVVTEIFAAVVGQTEYLLKWPANILLGSYTITIDNEEKLSAEATLYNKTITVDGSPRLVGVLRFANNLIIGSGTEIKVSYEKEISAMTAVERIEYFYTAGPGRAGKELSQLMSGVEYSGVNVSGTGFDNTLGWDATPWFTNAWDAATESFDTSLSGGQFAVGSAAGINPAEIVVDGDGFVTPNTSYAPEELVPGEIVDTLNIEVEFSGGSGAPAIVSRHYVAGLAGETFNIGQTPATIESVFVTVDNNYLLKSQFTVDFLSKTVTIPGVVPGNRVSVVSFSLAGSTVYGSGTLISDGTSTDYVTDTSLYPQYAAYVTVNGVVTQVTTFEYANSVVGIRFATAPSANALINYLVVDSVSNSISNVSKETVTIDGSATYELLTAPAVSDPFESSVVVTALGKVLKAPEFVYFTVSGINRTYKLDNTSYPYNSLLVSDIEVYLNGTEINAGTSYTWNSLTNELKLKKGVAKSSDTIVVEIQQGAEYRLHSNVLEILIPLNTGTVVEVTTFNNHDILQIEKTTVKGASATPVANNSVNYYKFNNISTGRITLTAPLVKPEHAWISLNDVLLTNNIDYIVEDDLKTIQLSPTINVSDTDVVTVVAFAAPIATPNFGYTVFKDMIGRVIYKKKDHSTVKLAKELLITDTEIEVDDSSLLAEPSAGSNVPGVIMIQGERIEYFVKAGNVLRQLRRATLGTGAANSYQLGTVVKAAGENTTIPYKDTASIIDVVSDGSSQIVFLDFVPTKTTNDDWYRDTIPANYGQNDEVEVYVGGRRLAKAPCRTWNDTMSFDDIVTKEAEFSVNGVDNHIRLTEVPPEGVSIRVIRRMGKMWTTIGESMTLSQSLESIFIRK